jgi:hypothetical protein
MLTLSLATLVSIQASAQILQSSTSTQSPQSPSAESTGATNNTLSESEDTASRATGAPVVDESKKESREEDLPTEKTKFRWRLGGISVGAGYTHYSGAYGYPYVYPYFYPPFGYFPGEWVGASYWYPLPNSYPFYGPGTFAHTDGRGQVRLTADPKAAEVYIDGGYAGTADKLKSLWLDPGAYDLTLSAASHEDFHQRVYVLSGKSLKITAKLNPENSKEKP